MATYIIDENILSSVECPVCYSTMFPPIMTCKVGHSICNSCLQKIDNCPMCKEPMSTVRNYSLESLMEKIVLPCKNSSSGCTFIERGVKKILKHMEKCEYSPRKCPFFKYPQMRCEWEGAFLDMEKHILDCNFQNVVRNPITFPFLAISNKHLCRLVIFAFGEIFLFSIENHKLAYRIDTNIISNNSEDFQYIVTIKKNGQILNKFKKTVTYISDYSEKLDPKKSNEFKITESNFYAIVIKLEIVSSK